MKYDNVKVTFQEVPNEISLTITISGCKNNCDGCHSPHLREDIGDELNLIVFDHLINKHKYITCVVFLGGDHKSAELIKLLLYARAKGLKTALYSGNNYDQIHTALLKNLDYVKVGRYEKEKGPLSSPTTNQIMLDLKTGEDITFMFWKGHEVT